MEFADYEQVSATLPRRLASFALRPCAGVALVLAATLLTGSAAAADVLPGRIVRLDPRIDRLIPPAARLEKIADGYAWLEGPAWNRQGGYLLFTDIPDNAVHKWQPGRGTSLYIKPSGYTGSLPFAGREPGANGLAFDRDGRLVLAEHGDRRVARLEADGRKTTLAARYLGRRLNSPNDLVFKSNGDLYFTDPPFGLPAAFDDPAKELDFQGVYRLKPDGELTLLTRDLKAPNGIAFSPDEKTLYLTDVDPKRSAWLAYEVKEDGTLGAGRVLFDATAISGPGRGAPDGVKVDRDGNLYGAGPGGVFVIAADGTHLGTVVTGVATANVAWGGDGSTLYVTAGTAVYRIRLSTRGAGF
jgi:gluconolactonase